MSPFPLGGAALPLPRGSWRTLGALGPPGGCCLRQRGRHEAAADGDLGGTEPLQQRRAHLVAQALLRQSRQQALEAVLSLRLYTFREVGNSELLGLFLSLLERACPYGTIFGGFRDLQSCSTLDRPLL